MRATAELVAEVIEVDPAIDLDPFILTASQLVDLVEANSDLSTAVLQNIERWLAAHFYTLRDPRTTSERAGSVMENYQSSVGPGLATSHYGQAAMALDTSGTLRNLSRGKRQASMFWAGTGC